MIQTSFQLRFGVNAMASHEDRFTGIDQNIAANLRTYREAASVSQEELAQRMADRGFGFSQATIWKIESGQRPVRVSELVALGDSLRVFPFTSLTSEPGEARHRAELRQANRNAHDAYEELKAAAAAYIEAQIELVVLARSAHDDGITVTELDTSWLSTPPEEAVIQARIEGDQEAALGWQVNEEVGKVLDALRTSGYEPSLRIEDVEVSGGGGGPVPRWAPSTTDERHAGESPNGST
jgi:transcriptional regulator with XRE-family HTH domain